MNQNVTKSGKNIAMS